MFKDCQLKAPPISFRTLMHIVPDIRSILLDIIRKEIHFLKINASPESLYKYHYQVLASSIHSNSIQILSFLLLLSLFMQNNNSLIFFDYKV